MFHPAFLYELDDPARIEVDTKADAAANLTEMFDGQPQSAGSGRTEHEPVRSLGEILLGQSVAEHFVVDAEIINDDAALRNTGRAARFKHVDRLLLQGLGDPTADRSATEPFVLEQAKKFQIVKAVH